MNNRLSKYVTIFDGQAADANSAAIDTKSYRHIMIVVGSDAAADFSIKFKGAIAESADDFDFTATADDTNLWDYIQVKDREDDSGIDGDTGIAVSGAGVRQFNANIDLIDYISVEMLSYAAGSATVKIKGCSNA